MGGNITGSISALKISVKSSSEDLFLGVDESYNLSISGGSGVTGELTANTIWGALRVPVNLPFFRNNEKQGIETFSQLVEWNGESSFVIYSV